MGGGCIHTIQRGRGAFKNVEGVIKIIDVVAGVTGDPVSGAFAPGTGGNRTSSITPVYISTTTTS